MFLRLGYGFDDPANKYEPDVYVSAWKNFHGRIQAKASTQVALVWQSASLCGESNGGHPLVDWYPGDKFVDWVGANYGECVDEVVQFAREHYKPVMLEAATQGAGSDANEIWNGWFAPFFKFVDDHNDVVHAVAYVNDGDSRIQLNDEIIKRWKDETKQPFWLRGGPDLFDTLGFAE